jgi:hypothetical protein
MEELSPVRVVTPEGAVKEETPADFKNRTESSMQKDRSSEIFRPMLCSIARSKLSSRGSTMIWALCMCVSQKAKH